jgi:hypothetical protein
MRHDSLIRINGSTEDEIRRFQMASITTKSLGYDQKPDKNYQVCDRRHWARQHVSAELLHPTFRFYTYGLTVTLYVTDALES